MSSSESCACTSRTSALRRAADCTPPPPPKTLDPSTDMNTMATGGMRDGAMAVGDSGGRS
jgi:hypothetical protein